MKTLQFDEWRGSGWLSSIALALIRFYPFHRGRTRLACSLANVLFAGRFPLRGHGATIKVNVGDFIGQRMCRGEGFEPRTLSRAVELMRDGGWFVDVGCNFGLFTCVLGGLPGVQVLAVDPSPDALVELEANLNLNPGVACTRVMVALSSSEELCLIERRGDCNLGATGVSACREQIRGGMVVQALPARVLIDRVRPFPLQLMKIDVEGHELEVLRGWSSDRELLPKHILCEHIPGLAGNESIDEVVTLLTDRGYKPFTVDGREWLPGMDLPEDNMWWQLKNEVKHVP